MDCLKRNNRKPTCLIFVTNPLEITQWLNGTYNFDMETLIELERVLDIKPLNFQKHACK